LSVAGNFFDASSRPECTISGEVLHRPGADHRAQSPHRLSGPRCGTEAGHDRGQPIIGAGPGEDDEPTEAEPDGTDPLARPPRNGASCGRPLHRESQPWFPRDHDQVRAISADGRKHLLGAVPGQHLHLGRHAECGLALKRAGNAILELVGGPIHPTNVRVGGFYSAPSRAQLDQLAVQVRPALDAAIATASWVAGFTVPDLELDHE
jgi:hypothetical protein